MTATNDTDHTGCVNTPPTTLTSATDTNHTGLPFTSTASCSPGLSSFFAVVVISTLLLIQHLPRHPNDERGPFWDVGRDTRFRTHEENHEEQPKRQGNEPLHAIEQNRSRYRCLIHPVEIFQLDDAARTYIASPDHILLTQESNQQKAEPFQITPLPIVFTSPSLRHVCIFSLSYFTTLLLFQ